MDGDKLTLADVSPVRDDIASRTNGAAVVKSNPQAVRPDRARIFPAVTKNPSLACTEREVQQQVLPSLVLFQEASGILLLIISITCT